MARKPLASTEYEVEDLEEAIDLYYRRGWTDGLPVVPPTQERVWRFLEAARREPDEVLGVYLDRHRVVTVEKVAINAVMAGCLPEYLPVVLAIIEGMLEPGWGLHPANSTTGGAAIGFVINGPVRLSIGMNHQGNVMGPGNRANSTIGRAVRLTQINVMGSVSGAGGDAASSRDIFDRATLGQPAKYACYHIVENEEDFPSLLPLHVERGFGKEQSVATVFGTSGHVQVAVHGEHSAEETVETIARHMVTTGKFHVGSTPGADRAASPKFCVIVIPPEKAEYFVRDGWSKGDIRNAIFERTRRSVAWVKEQGWFADGAWGRRNGGPRPGDEQHMLDLIESPDHVLAVVAGAPAGPFAQFMLPYYMTRPTSRVIKL